MVTSSRTNRKTIIVLSEKKIIARRTQIAVVRKMCSGSNASCWLIFFHIIIIYIIYFFNSRFLHHYSPIRQWASSIVVLVNSFNGRNMRWVGACWYWSLLVFAVHSGAQKPVSARAVPESCHFVFAYPETGALATWVGCFRRGCSYGAGANRWAWVGVSERV